MPLDPQARFVLDQLAALGGPPLHELAPAAARAAFDHLRSPAPGEPVERIEERSIWGPDGNAIAVRLYAPADAARLGPALVYFHGGGWVIGNLDTHDHLCRALANRSGARVVSVDYRLAPESPLRAEKLEGLPAATVLTAEFDPLRDEGEAYAERLRIAGVATTATRYDGQIHGFVSLLDLFDAGRRAVDRIGATLRAELA